MRSRNLFTFIFGNRRPDGTCCLPVPGFANILISDPDGRKAWFDGLYVQVDRPYGGGRVKHGYSVTYTLGQLRADRRRSLQPGLPDASRTIRAIPPAPTSGTGS